MNYALFLQGVNVGGNRRLPMQDLKKCLESLGFSGVRTYIQSGNAVFAAESAAEDAIERALSGLAGFAVPCVLRTKAELAAVIDNMPFPGCDESHLCVTFLQSAPPAPAAAEFSALDFSPDRFLLAGREIYLLCAAGFSDTKLTNALAARRLKTVATNRNWRTIHKVYEMMQEGYDGK